MRHGIVTSQGGLTLQRLACVWGMGLVSALAASADALPSYNLVTLGFTDVEHTRNDGMQYSDVTYLTESYVTGVSVRFDGGATDVGGSAWLYDPSDDSTTRLGYVDATHTRSDGYRSSYVGVPQRVGLRDRRVEPPRRRP